MEWIASCKRKITLVDLIWKSYFPYTCTFLFDKL